MTQKEGESISFTSLTYIYKLLICKDQRAMQLWMLIFSLWHLASESSHCTTIYTFLMLPPVNCCYTEVVVLIWFRVQHPPKDRENSVSFGSVFTWLSATYNCILPDQTLKGFPVTLPCCPPKSIGQVHKTAVLRNETAWELHFVNVDLNHLAKFKVVQNKGKPPLCSVLFDYTHD